MRYGTSAVSTSSGTSWFAEGVVTFTYDGTNWIINDWVYNDNTYPQGYCPTAATTAAKLVTHTGYALTPNTYSMVTFAYANASLSALTLNINSKGAKPLWINGVASSAINATIPAGSYLVFYDGTKYYLRTDGVINGVYGGGILSSGTSNNSSSFCFAPSSGYVIYDDSVDTTPNVIADRCLVKNNNGSSSNKDMSMSIGTLNSSNTSKETDTFGFFTENCAGKRLQVVISVPTFSVSSGTISLGCSCEIAEGFGQDFQSTSPFLQLKIPDKIDTTFFSVSSMSAGNYTYYVNIPNHKAMFDSRSIVKFNFTGKRTGGTFSGATIKKIQIVD